MPRMPYCENCGSQINPNAKFCRNCGKPVNMEMDNAQQSPAQMPNAAPPPPPPPPQIIQAAQSPPMAPSAPLTQSGSEVVIGAMIFKKSKSFGRWDTYTGVLTNERLIFAQLTNEMLKDAVQQARDQAKAEGKGFWGQWSDQLKTTYGYTRKYLSMPPAAIFFETQGNFAINNNTISEIKLKDRLVRQDQQIYEFEVQIHSTNGKYEFTIDQNNDYIKLLKQVYGERVKTPLGYFSKSINIHF